MAKYILRIDDICQTMDWEKFRKFEKLFLKYNIKPIIGVIPSNKDKKFNFKPRKDFWNKIIELKKNGWTISQHGFEHKYTSKNSGILKINERSEFAGVGYSAQLNKLEEGKKILSERKIPSEIFMAPAHSFDENTIKALKKLKFKFVTDGYGLYPYKFKDLVFVPQLFSFGFKFPFGIFTICLHPNSMPEKQLKKLEKFIEGNHKNFISFEESTKYVKNNIFNKISYHLTFLLRQILKKLL